MKDKGTPAVSRTVEPLVRAISDLFFGKRNGPLYLEMRDKPNAGESLGDISGRWTKRQIRAQLRQLLSANARNQGLAPRGENP